MANCKYLTDHNDGALTCPETDPSDDRCAICILLLLYDKCLYSGKKKLIAAKLPA